MSFFGACKKEAKGPGHFLIHILILKQQAIKHAVETKSFFANRASFIRICSGVLKRSLETDLFKRPVTTLASPSDISKQSFALNQSLF